MNGVNLGSIGRGGSKAHLAVRTALLACALLPALPALAIQLGTPVVESSIGQPLRAEIEVVANPSENPDQIKAHIVEDESDANSALAVLPPDGVALNLTQRQGRLFLLLTSQYRINEPMLRLRLEVSDGKDSVQGQYDVLLNADSVFREPVENTTPTAAESAATAATAATAAPAMQEAPHLRADEGAPNAQPAKPKHARKSQPPAAAAPATATSAVDAEPTHSASAGTQPTPAPAAPTAATAPPPVAATATQPGAAGPPPPPALRFSESITGPIPDHPVPPAPLPAAPMPAAPKPVAAAPTAPQAEESSGGVSLFSVVFALVFFAIGWLLADWRAARRASNAVVTAALSAPRRKALTVSLRPATPSAATPRAAESSPAPGDAVAATVDAPLPSQDLSEMDDAESEPELHFGSYSDFHSEISDLLTKVLEREPGREDLRIKLIETYFSVGRREDFLEQVEAYLKLHPAHDGRWPEIEKMGQALAPDSPLFGGIDKPHPELHTLEVRGPVARDATSRRFYEMVPASELHKVSAPLAEHYQQLRRDPEFHKTLIREFADFLGRPTPLQRLNKIPHLPEGVSLFLKLEDQRGRDEQLLLNAVGQVLIASTLHANRVIAATAIGAHGIAVATAAARRNMPCTIYVDEKALGKGIVLRRMSDLGATVRTVRQTVDNPGADPRVAAFADWIGDSSAICVSDITGGPPPYNSIVFDIHAVIGEEVAAQLHQASQATRTVLVANRVGGVETFGFLTPFIDDENAQLVLVDPQAAGDELPPQPLLRREHQWLRDSGRVRYVPVSASAASEARRSALVAESTRISPLDSYVFAGALQLAAEAESGTCIVALMSGGDVKKELELMTA